MYMTEFTYILNLGLCAKKYSIECMVKFGDETRAGRWGTQKVIYYIYTITIIYNNKLYKNYDLPHKESNVGSGGEKGASFVMGGGHQKAGLGGSCAQMPPPHPHPPPTPQPPHPYVDAIDSEAAPRGGLGPSPAP